DGSSRDQTRAAVKRSSTTGSQAPCPRTDQVFFQLTPNSHQATQTRRRDHWKRKEVRLTRSPLRRTTICLMASQFSTTILSPSQEQCRITPGSKMTGERLHSAGDTIATVCD